MSLIIAGITIPFDDAGSAFGISQNYQPFGPRKVMRARSGAGRVASRWAKLKSTISGSSWLPVGLDGISKNTAVAVSCVAPLCIAEADNAITLPHSYRTDAPYAPFGIAIVNGQPVETTASMVGQVCTLGTVAGASQYQVNYYPILTGFISVTRAHDVQREQGGWTIEFEQQ